MHPGKDARTLPTHAAAAVRRVAERPGPRAADPAHALLRLRAGAAATPRDVLLLQRTVGNRVVGGLLSRGPRVVQRTQVTELTSDDQDKWFVIQGSRVGKLSDVTLDESDPRKNRWEFRVQDDVHGRSRFVYLTEGKVVPLPSFGTVIERMYKDNEENWFGEHAERVGLEAQKARKPGKIEQMKEEDLRELGSQTEGGYVGEDEWNTTRVGVDQALWTDGMGPCITIAMTGVLKGFRINVLHHSFAMHYDASTYPAMGEKILDELEKKVADFVGESFSAVQKKEFYVVGGDKDAAPKMEALLRGMIERQYNLAGVVDATVEKPGKSSKALLITGDGKVAWSYRETP